jgi:hypothetical protein
MATDIFDMTDEEFDRLDPSTLSDESADEITTENESDTTDETPAQDNTEDENQSVESEGDETESDDSTADSDESTTEEREEGVEQPDGQESSSESDEESDTSEGQPNEEPTDRYKVKANGMELEVTLDDLLKAYPKSANFTKKMQEIAPYRRSITAMAENGITEDDINTIIDIKKGSKEALAKLLKDAEVDPLDLDTENINYSPNQYGQDENQYRLAEIHKEISNDPEFNTTRKVIDVDWDDKSRQFFLENPEAIRMLHNDVKTGVYSRVAPEALRLKLADDGRLPDVDYYRQAGSLLYGQSEQVQDRAAEFQQQQNSNRQNLTKQKKAVAAPSKKKAKPAPILDYLEMSDDEFEKEMARRGTL